ncbi:hypothetical protein [Mycobacterium paraterrae]|uniref:carbonic anhydrase n=1 Tax=Mycobacterium paraterrae TaxID=577492 RepID=A0ABY3VSK9_9MYCO|nr:hypothetical protein [Mycobacterium paraterrae]UMB69574.1 hypothetical protein MKK62_25110 [Mycobacterium paraterrae]
MGNTAQEPTGLDRYVYSQSPGYDERAVRAAFHAAVPLSTIAIFCYDPRAAKIPYALSTLLPGEVYPGQVVYDDDGKKVGGTATIMPVVVAGGRAVDALRSITIGHHLFGLRHVAVVHHTNCGTSSFTPSGLLHAYQEEQAVDIATVYDRDDLAITHLEASLHHDVELLRSSPAIPRSVDITGYVYDIDRDAFLDVAIRPST